MSQVRRQVPTRKAAWSSAYTARVQAQPGMAQPMDAHVSTCSQNGQGWQVSPYGRSDGAHTEFYAQGRPRSVTTKGQDAINKQADRRRPKRVARQAARREMHAARLSYCIEEIGKAGR